MVAWGSLLTGAGGFFAGDVVKRQLSLSKDSTSVLIGAADSYNLWSNLILKSTEQYQLNYTNLQELNKEGKFHDLEHHDAMQLTADSVLSICLIKIADYEKFRFEISKKNIDLNRNIAKEAGNPDWAKEPDFQFNHREYFNGDYHRLDPKGQQKLEKLDLDLSGTKYGKVNPALLRWYVPNDTEVAISEKYKHQVGNQELASAGLDLYQVFSQSMNAITCGWLDALGLGVKANEFANVIDFYEPMTQQYGDGYRLMNYKNFSQKQIEKIVKDKELTPEKYDNLSDTQKDIIKAITYNGLDEKQQKKVREQLEEEGKTALVSWLTTESIGPMQTLFGLTANSMHPGAKSVLIRQTMMRSDMFIQLFETISDYTLKNFDDPSCKLPIEKPQNFKSEKLNIENYSIKDYFKEKFGIESKDQITKSMLIDSFIEGSENVINNSPLARSFGALSKGFAKYVQFFVKSRIDLNENINDLPDGKFPTDNGAKFDFGQNKHAIWGIISVVSHLKKGTTTYTMAQAAAPMIREPYSNMFAENNIKVQEKVHPALQNEHGHKPNRARNPLGSIFELDKVDIKEQMSFYNAKYTSKYEDSGPAPTMPQIRKTVGILKYAKFASGAGKGGPTRTILKGLAITTGIVGVLGGGVYMVNKHFKDKAAEEYNIQWRKDHGLDKDSAGAAKSGVDVNGADKEKNAKEDKKFPAVQKNPYQPGTPDYQNWRTDSVIYQNATSMNSEEVYKNKDYKLVKVGTELVMFSVKPVNNLENNKAIS